MIDILNDAGLAANQRAKGDDLANIVVPGFFADLAAVQAAMPGAVAATDTYDFCAIQSVLNRFTASAGGKAYLPGNRIPTPGAITSFAAASYRINRVLRVPTRVVPAGDGWSSCIKRIGRDAGMPLAVVGEPLSPITRGTSLATGSGNCWVNATSELPKKQINVSDVFDLNGMSAFSWQGFVKITNGTSGSIAGSYGTRWGTNPLPPGNTVGYQLFLHPSLGTFGVFMTVGGTQYAFNSSGGALTLNQTYYVELNYNGSTIRLFIDGVQVGSQAATGTITAKYWEDHRIGGDTTTVGFGYQLDSVRLSNIARNTSNYTPPTAKHSVDANTKFLVNFDEFDDRVCCIGFQSGFKIDGTAGGDGLGWIFTRDLADSLLGGVHQFAGLRELRFEDGAPGVIRHFSQHGCDDHLYLFNCWGGYDMRKWSYSNEVRDFYFDGVTTTGIRQEQGSGMNRWAHGTMRGGKAAIAAEESYSSSFSDLFTFDFSGAHGVFGGVESGGVVLGPWQWNDEGNTQPESGVVFRLASFVFLGGLGGLFNSGPTIPQVEVFSDRANTGTFIGTWFTVGTTTPAAIKNPNTPPSGGTGLPPNLLGCAQNRLVGVTADKPWVDSGTVTLVGSVAAPGAIVSATVAGFGIIPAHPRAYWTGTDFVIPITLSSPADITGMTLAGYVRPLDGGSPILTKTNGAGLTIDTVAPPVVRISFAAADLAAGQYKWELARTDSGSADVFAWGPLYIRQR